MTSSWVGWMCPFGAESGGNTEKPTVRFLEPLISGPICVGHADQFYVISAGGTVGQPLADHAVSRHSYLDFGHH